MFEFYLFKGAGRRRSEDRSCFTHSKNQFELYDSQITKK